MSTPEPPRDPPPELERRIQRILTLSGAARREAEQQFRVEHPEHVTALDQRLGRATADSAGEPVHQLGSVEERLRRLSARAPMTTARYLLRGEIARGGMGAILRAYDQDLGRTLAMKVILGPTEAQSGETSAVDPQVLERFVEEAQITGQLDHPGVVPVHELGLDATGRVYFTMRLVKGRTAHEIFGLVRAATEGWTQTRALEVLLKVCDTLAYAHSKGVVHRDLKPTNVMVGKFGEVYVMDWGLAKVLGRTDTRDLRIKPPDSASLSRVRTDRERQAESDPDTALRTMDGAIVGTPCYMPPEQAEGRVEDVGIRSDVYAAGAMLYTLLTGQQPYIKPQAKTSPYMVLMWVRQGPPTPVHEIDPTVPAELVAICEKAMARQPEARYGDMGALADDLRAYLERRVVRAYRTGARAELGMWVRRNRGMAAGLLAATSALILGGLGALVYARRADSAQQEALREKQVAEALRGDAETARGSAEQALRDFLAEQLRKQELEERLELQRSRERRNTAMAHWKERNALAQQARRQAMEEPAATVRAVDAQLRTLADLLPWSPSSAPPEKAAALAQLFDQLVAQLAGKAPLAGWRAWVQGSWLLSAGHAGGAVPVLRDGLPAKPPTDANGTLLVAVLRRALAEAHTQLSQPAEAIANFARAIEHLHSRGHNLLLGVETARDCAAYLVRATDSAIGERELRPLHSCLARLGVQDDIAATGSSTSGPPPDVDLRCLRAVVLTTQGRLHEALTEFRQVTGAEAPWLAMIAMNQRLRGRLDAALTSARAGRAGASNLAQLHASVLEEVRAWRAVHRPRAALDLLEQHAAKLAEGRAQPTLEAEVFEARASCQADLTLWEDAIASLVAAARLVPRSDLRTRGRLDGMRGELLLHLGRATQAIEAYGGVPVADVSAPADLPLTAQLGLAAAAEQGGRTELADTVLVQAATRISGGAAREQAEVLLLRTNLLLGRGQSAAAAQQLDSLRSLLPRFDDAWLEARIHVQMAQVLATSDPGMAMPHLDRAARAITAWLRDYSRFQRELTSPTQLATLRSLGQTAIATLIEIAPHLVAADTESAWLVLETFREITQKTAMTRPARFARAPADQELVGRYENENARALELARRLTAISDAADSVGAAERRRLADALARQRRVLDELEHQLRERMPAYWGAVCPRIPKLADVMTVLPADTALVVFGAAAGRAVAFVATRASAALVPLSMATDPGRDATALAIAASAAERQDVLDRLGAGLIAPVVVRLAAGPPIRTLLLAPAAELCGIPFELCTLTEAGRAEPLIARHDVAYVPSGSACFDQINQRRRFRASPGRGGLALVQGAPTDRITSADWIAPALVAEVGDEVLLRSVANPAPADRELHGRTLDLLLGSNATEAGLVRAAPTRRALALALDLETRAGAPHHAWLRCGGDPAGEHDGRITMQDLRDLGSRANFALVRNQAAGADPVVEAQALTGFAAGLWSGGTPTVVTVGSGADPASGSKLVSAFLQARRGGSDGISEWCDAWRQELGRGAHFVGSGVRLWSVKK